MKRFLASLFGVLLLSSAALAQGTAVRSANPATFSVDSSGQLSISAPCALTAGASIAVDLSRCNFFTVTETTTGNTYANPTNGILGASYLFQRTVSGTDITPTWGSSYTFANGGTVPSLSTSTATDLFGCIVLAKSGTNVTNFFCQPIALNVAPTFDPSTLSNTQIWLDASDHSTTFAGAACTGGTVSTGGSTVGSWKDKSSNALCFASSGGTNTLQTDGSGRWWIAPHSGGVFMSTTGTTGRAILQNKQVMSMMVGGQFVAGTETTFETFGTDGDIGGWRCGFDPLGNPTDSGPGVTAKRVVTDPEGNLVTGTEVGYTGSPQAVFCNVLYYNGNGYLRINNSTPLNNDTIVTTGATTNSPAGANPFLYNTGSSARVYYIQGWTPTTGPLTEQTQLGTYVCQKMGIIC